MGSPRQRAKAGGRPSECPSWSTLFITPPSLVTWINSESRDCSGVWGDEASAGDMGALLIDPRGVPVSSWIPAWVFSHSSEGECIGVMCQVFIVRFADYPWYWRGMTGRARASHETNFICRTMLSTFMTEPRASGWSEEKFARMNMSSRASMFGLFLFTLIVASARAHDFKGPNTVELTADNYEATVCAYDRSLDLWLCMIG